MTRPKTLRLVLCTQSLLVATILLVTCFLSFTRPIAAGDTPVPIFSDSALFLPYMSGQPRQGDFGDAPDSLFAPQPMTAYFTGSAAGQLAHFPSIYTPGQVSGPYHQQPQEIAYLGTAVSLEHNSDQLPDEDEVTNISPDNDLADNDGEDDGFEIIYGLEIPCTPTVLTVTVTIEEPETPLYLNSWFDFDRDGDWDDWALCEEGFLVEEWVVQDLPLAPLPAGTHIISTTITTGAVSETIATDPLWIRFTLGPQPALELPPDGSGPPEGYLFGETEDYHLECEDCDVGPNPVARAGWSG